MMKLGMLVSAIRLVAFTLLALTPAVASAQSPTYVPAARYYGSVNAYGPPPAGSGTVTAQGIGGAFCGSGSIYFDGSYSLDIQASSACSGTITFFVNGQPANQTSVLPNYLSGAVLLNLTVGCNCPCSYGTPSYACPPPPLPPPPPQPPAPYPPPPPGPYPPPYGPVVTVTYQPGWNLVGGPAATVLAGASGPLFTFQPGDAAYETLPPGSPLQAGYGYWALFTSPTSVSLPVTGPTSVYRTIPPGQIALIGNPFSRPATVSGAGAVFIYDPVRGYQTTTILQPGQGAWATGGGGQVVIQST
jgi:hypothetical protein